MKRKDSRRPAALPAAPAAARRLRRRARFAVLVLLALGGAAAAFVDAPGTAQATERFAGRARVVDGDTLAIGDARLRLVHVDAPETAQTCRDRTGRDYACGEAATRALTALIGGREVRCAAEARDRYERPLAVCEAGSRDLNAAMVAGGWAVVYRKFSDRYEAEEDAARAARLGLWSGQFEPPWDYRARLRAEAAAKSVPRPADEVLSGKDGVGKDCAIKGNVSNSGQIYHMPGQADYERTRISTAKGERWFCTEAEARAAGWRPAQR